jgi:hypothetical protein
LNKPENAVVRVPEGGSVEVRTISLPVGKKEPPPQDAPPPDSTRTNDPRDDAPHPPVVAEVASDDEPPPSDNVPTLDPPPPQPMPGEGGLALDGRSTRIELTTVKLDMKKPFTIEAILDLETPADEAIIASNISGAGGFRFSINKDGWWSFKWANGRALFGRGGPGKKEGSLHAAAVWDGTDVKVFVDGRSVIAGGGALPLTDVPPKAVPLLLGAEAGPDGKPRRHLAGSLKQVRISRTARYGGGFSAPQSLEADEETLALYLFTDGSVPNTARDASGHKHDGKLFGTRRQESR